MPITTLDTSNTSTVTFLQHADKTNEVINSTNSLTANVTTLQTQKANTSLMTSQLALKANTAFVTSQLALKANTTHPHTYTELLGKPTTLSGFNVTSLDLGTNPTTFKANTTLVRVKSATTNTNITSSLIQISDTTKTVSITPSSMNLGNTTVKTYKDFSKFTAISPSANSEMTSSKVKVATPSTSSWMTSTLISVKGAAANTQITSSGITLANSSVSFTLSKPSAAQVSDGSYYLGANGVWQQSSGQYVVQVTETVNSTQTLTGSISTFPKDATIPQNTEGYEVMTHTHTPLAAGHKLLISCEISAQDASYYGCMAALFRDSVADAMMVGSLGAIIASGNDGRGIISYVYTAPDTTPITFKVRVAPGYTAGTIGINRNPGGAYYGGSQQSFIRVTEYDTTASFSGTDKIPDGTYGDVVVSSGGTNWTVVPNAIDLKTPVAAAGQTSIDFTGISADAKRIVILFNEFSSNNSSPLLVQIGDSGGIETTGYTSVGTQAHASVGSTAFTNGFGFSNAWAAASLSSGRLVLEKFDSTTWIASGMTTNGSTTGTQFTNGAKVLSSSPLDRVRITTFAGTATFDSGSVTIMVEK